MRRVRQLIVLALGLLFLRWQWRADWEQRFQRGWRGLVRRIDAATDLIEGLGDPAPGVGEGRPPVLLLGGYANDERAMGAIRRSLERDGFDAYAMTLPGFGMGDLLAMRDIVREQVRWIRQRTGQHIVHVVGYSSGGFVARAAAQLDAGDDHGIGRVVTIATANSGFHFGPFNRIVDRLAPHGLRQVRRGSELVSALHDSRDTADVVSIGTFGTDWFVPNPSGFRIADKPFHAVDDGRRFGPFSRVTHARMVRDDRTYELVRSALLADDRH